MNLICGKLGTGIHCVKSIRIRVILGRIFQHLDWMPRDAFLSVFNLNVGKYGAQQLHIPTLHMLRKSMDWFLYDNILRHERVNHNKILLRFDVKSCHIYLGRVHIFCFLRWVTKAYMIYLFCIQSWDYHALQ